MKYILLIILAVFIVLTPYTATYDKEAYRYEQFVEKGACVWYQCPSYLQEEMLAEHNGVYPPTAYPLRSKEWWRAFCTYSPELCVY